MTRLGDQPIEPKLDVMMNALAGGINNILNGDERPRRNGFVLMVFPFDDFAGRCNYISNAQREDIIVLLKEQLSRFEGMAENQGDGMTPPLGDLKPETRHLNLTWSMADADRASGYRPTNVKPLSNVISWWRTPGKKTTRIVTRHVPRR